MKFHDEFYITGRGLVLTFIYEDDNDKDFKVGEKLVHKGKVYTITGIEGSMYLTCPPRRNPHVAVIVRECKEYE